MNLKEVIQKRAKNYIMLNIGLIIICALLFGFIITRKSVTESFKPVTEIHTYDELNVARYNSKYVRIYFEDAYETGYVYNYDGKTVAEYIDFDIDGYSLVGIVKKDEAKKIIDGSKKYVEGRLEKFTGENKSAFDEYVKDYVNKYKDEYGRYISNGTYKTTLPENYKLTVRYKCIYFSDNEDYFINLWRYDLIYNEKNIKENEIEINLTIPIINEKEIAIRYFNEPIYHELTHAYESIKCGGGFFGSDKNAEQYKRITDIVLKKKGSEKIIKVARCIYACYKFERNAFVHSLYSKMAQYNTLEICYLYDKLKETDQYSYLMDIKTILDNPKEYEKEIKELTGQNYTTFEKYIQKRYKKYMSSIGKIFQRIVIDNMGNIPVSQFTDIDDVLSDII